ncbi:DUF58 domain-containing protein [Massilia forsythiae]|uniref:DUF58 domain-containing protein n=1 Tax=Massilia forsythiae TaxID=2728020 RepID=A0A7Z2VVL7_9BURK|nr:DUF58 domain-containing protein [Massilia forsythiae]QJD99721.1 DUF58 domain-containing protein [Massilia forsythiae]
MAAASALGAHTGKLDLAVRHVLAGLGHGIHAGRERGAGVEFSEYRAYVPGDEWRRVDWKLLARADRYYVREAERDSHVAAWLVLDASVSMDEPSRSVDGLTKLGCARLLLACVAALAQRQGDAFGLVVCQGERAEVLPAARGPRHLQRVLARLDGVTAGGALPDAAALRAALHFTHASGLVCAAGDWLDWPSPLSEALVRLRRMRHDVRLLCLQTEAEVAGGFDAAPAYRDPERPDGVFRFGRDVRAAYLRNREAHFGTVNAECRRNDVPLLAACIERAPGAILREWLRTAQRRTGRA